ncbi:hypothetical protein EN759_00415 [Mesorhizobium sp. M00.F.Ca.ET.038.03.1.1]|nr:hypothetical protein EN759_00415 [Mesorhizobium sp. M00.F.Ca.ET.038.03.1.1]TIW04130.1 MAG: hypothetical protein E5V77_01495 [Mesorhizobium sp.]
MDGAYAFLTPLELQAFEGLRAAQQLVRGDAGAARTPVDAISRQLHIAYTAAALPPKREFPAAPSADYLGALIDGEGHIGINRIIRRNPSGSVRAQYMSRVQVASIDFELVRPLVEFGGTITAVDAARWNKNARCTEKWEIHSQQAAEFLRHVLPSIRSERKRRVAQAVIVLEFLRRPPGKGGNIPDPLRATIQEALRRYVLLQNSPGRELEVSTPDVEKALHLVQTMIDGHRGRDDRLPFRNVREVQFAETIIRLLKTASHLGFDLASAVVEKNQFDNTARAS